MSPKLLRLQTPRLELISGTVAMLEADLAGREELAAALKVEVPKAWPPISWDREPIEFLIGWMRRRPDAAGWFAWYCVQKGEIVDSEKQNTLIGGLGFLGPPNAAGETAIGYSLLSNFHRQGYGPEALCALIDWAFAHGELKTLVVRTMAHHRPSIRVAEKLGFEFAGPGPEQDTVEYVLCRKEWKGLQRGD